MLGTADGNVFASWDETPRMIGVREAAESFAVGSTMPTGFPRRAMGRGKATETSCADAAAAKT